MSVRAFGIGILGITGLAACQHPPADNTTNQPPQNTPVDTPETIASTAHSLRSVASSVHSISTHIATTVMSGDTVKVVHEIVMPTNDALTLTDYQKAYLDSMQQGKLGRQQARTANGADMIFVRSIIAHHLGAIRMANIELQYGQNPEMRKLAQDILVSEQNEITVLQNWLNTTPDNPPPESQTTAHQIDDIRQEYASGLDDMNAQMMLGIMSPNPDIAFAQAMLPHHKGALAMAQVELRYGDDDKIRHIADSIIDTQEGEIQLMQHWLQQQGKDSKIAVP